MAMFSLRLDDEAQEKIKIIAKKQARSKNKQIEFIINQYLEDYERVNGKIEIIKEGE